MAARPYTGAKQRLAYTLQLAAQLLALRKGRAMLVLSLLRTMFFNQGT